MKTLGTLTTQGSEESITFNDVDGIACEVRQGNTRVIEIRRGPLQPMRLDREQVKSLAMHLRSWLDSDTFKIASHDADRMQILVMIDQEESIRLGHAAPSSSEWFYLLPSEIPNKLRKIVGDNYNFGRKRLVINGREPKMARPVTSKKLFEEIERLANLPVATERTR